MNNAPINTNSKNINETKTEGIKMEVCDYNFIINNANNQSTNITTPIPVHHNPMAVLQRNTVSSASSLESSASNGYPVRKSPLNEQAQSPVLASIPAQHAMVSTAVTPNMPLSHNDKQNFITRPMTMPMPTPTSLSLIDSLKMKYSPSGPMGRNGGSSHFSDLTGLSSVSNFSEENESPLVGNTNVPEFLYQLIKMLTDNHREVIEWSNGKIEVHNPHKLESDVLNKYFRHSKYASFQRQLNYFGFRKLAGKGKMAPCSYVNELATSDLRSLLKMKRKTSATAKETKNDKLDETPSSEARPKIKQCSPFQKPHISTSTVHGMSNNAMSFCDRKRPIPCTAEIDREPRNVAKFTVGKGIRHSLNGYLKTPPTIIPTSSIGTTPTLNNPLIPNPITMPMTNILQPTLATSTAPTPIGSISRSLPSTTNPPIHDPQRIARSVVGKGVCHQFSSHTYQQTQSLITSANVATTTLPLKTDVNPPAPASTNISTTTQKQNHPNFLFLDPQQLGMGVEDSLSELQNNFRNSLNENRHPGDNENNGIATGGKMERVSSLVNLAMIPDLDSIQPTPVCEIRPPVEEALNSMAFIDFPSGGLDPTSLSLSSCSPMDKKQAP